MFISFILINIIVLILEHLSKKYMTSNITVIKNFNKKTIEINENVSITSIIENRKILPVNFLKITELMPKYTLSNDINLIFDSQNSIYELLTSIMPYQRIKYSYNVYFNRRGVYTNWETNIVAGDMLALDYVYKKFSNMNEIIVYPKSINIENEYVPLGSNSGDISIRRWIIDDPVITVGLKEYTGNEPFKSIHWMSSLRLNKLMARKYDYTTDSKVILILNIESSKPFYIHIDSENIEKSISNIRYLFEKFEEMGIPYGFTTNALINGYQNTYLQPGTGITHMNILLESLSRIDYAINDTFEDFLAKFYDKVESNALCIIVTIEVFREYIPIIDKLKRKLNNLVIITQKVYAKDDEILNNYNIYIPK